MTKPLGLEEASVTGGEKFLAFVLSVFMLIGGLWLYFEPLDRSDNYLRYDSREAAPISTWDEATIFSYSRARKALSTTKRTQAIRQDRLELAREAYRTELDAGRSATSERAKYRDTQGSYERAKSATALARKRLDALKPAYRLARENQIEAQREQSRQRAESVGSARRSEFLGRLFYVLVTLAVAYWFFNRMRKRQSRNLVVGMAFVGFATVLALVMATDYMTDYIEVAEVGPLALSLAGITLTLAAIFALQRYLRRQIPQRRVRKKQCPFCGYPSLPEVDYCEGCGRENVAECATCHKKRRVGTPYCGACGHA